MPTSICQVGEPVLRGRAKALTPDQIKSRTVQDLINDMREAMYQAPGVGLAAPQVGVPLQLAVIEDKPEYTKDAPPEFLAARERKPVPFHVIINPTLELLDQPEVEFFEGCLSLHGFTALVPRARRVKVQCLNQQGEATTIEASGWYARILQHEIDHLYGTIYIDRMLTRSFMNLEHFNQQWKSKSIAEVKALLVDEK